MLPQFALSVRSGLGQIVQHMRITVGRDQRGGVALHPWAHDACGDYGRVVAVGATTFADSRTPRIARRRYRWSFRLRLVVTDVPVASMNRAVTDAERTKQTLRSPTYRDTGHLSFDVASITTGRTMR
jgi:hypothetical protein